MKVVNKTKIALMIGELFLLAVFAFFIYFIYSNKNMINDLPGGIIIVLSIFLMLLTILTLFFVIFNIINWPFQYHFTSSTIHLKSFNPLIKSKIISFDETKSINYYLHNKSVFSLATIVLNNEDGRIVLPLVPVQMISIIKNKEKNIPIQKIDQNKIQTIGIDPISGKQSK